jgi:DNA-binding NarL/FixJ family response regulator
MTPGTVGRSVGGHSGRTPASLTNREREALAAYATTGSQREAAHLMGVRHQTIKNHLREAYDKLGASGAINAFRAIGWLQVPE